VKNISPKKKKKRKETLAHRGCENGRRKEVGVGQIRSVEQEVDEAL
jgi:hypothetical protein